MLTLYLQPPARAPTITECAGCNIDVMLYLQLVSLIYFGHVTRHNGLEKTIMQDMVAGERSRGKPRQRCEKYITDIFETYICCKIQSVLMFDGKFTA